MYNTSLCAKHSLDGKERHFWKKEFVMKIKFSNIILAVFYVYLSHDFHNNYGNMVAVICISFLCILLWFLFLSHLLTYHQSSKWITASSLLSGNCEVHFFIKGKTTVLEKNIKSLFTFTRTAVNFAESVEHTNATSAESPWKSSALFLLI